MPGNAYRVYYKTYYRPDDFNDSRYDPSFSPLLYPGQTMKWIDYKFAAVVQPKLGDHHNIQFRVQGGIRSYAVGLAPDRKIVLYKKCNGYKKLASGSFEWRHGGSQIELRRMK